MILLSLALLAPPALLPTPQSSCVLGTKIQVLGTVDSVSQTPAAPFAGIVVGESFRMNLSLGGDVLCVPLVGNLGHLATPLCCELDIGGTASPLDPALTDPCVWGETYGSPGFAFAESVFSDSPFADGNVRVVLEMQDSQGAVGIDIFSIINDTVVVADVTDPGFSIRMTLEDPMGVELAVIDVLELNGTGSLFGLHYCTANGNSSGGRGFIGLQGSPSISQDDLVLHAALLPQNVFGYFLTSQTQGFIPNPAGSAGNLCVAGSIGRYVGPGQIQSSGSAGLISLPIHPMTMPQPNGTQAALPGETWNFTSITSQQKRQNSGT